MASLIDQIFLQAQAGSAGGQGFGDFYAQGRQMAQEERRINLSEQQLARQLAYDQINMIGMRQEQSQKAFEIENYLKGQAAMSTLGNEINTALSEAGTIDAMRLHVQAGKNNPDLFFSPQYKQMGQLLENLAQQQIQADYKLSQAEALAARIETERIRSENSRLNTELREQQMELSMQRETRLREQFEESKQRFESKVPPERLAMFRERAKSIGKDLTLLGNAAERDRRLKALAEEMGFSTPIAPAGSPPPLGSNQPSTSGFKVKIIKP